ncbi:hypothetical protein F8M41_024992 [Gigaspora margarita]|uniref:Uncharacterized protein n=1 Tax=Gigaspora margarita TaxID=4874 RepID=A0A8H3XL48_GIGMA|nr:hypothetical protein F8M41_024992 [Gigaspora margarita]
MCLPGIFVKQFLKLLHFYVTNISTIISNATTYNTVISMINLTSTGVSYGVTLDAEVATLYSVTTDDQKLKSLDIEDPIPLRDSPDFAIKGTF